MNGANVYVGNWERKSYWHEQITKTTKTYFFCKYFLFFLLIHIKLSTVFSLIKLRYLIL